MKRLNKFLITILALATFLPNKADAFIDFCFPISSTILLVVLGWPSMIIYEFFTEKISGDSFAFISIGILVNLMVVAGIGLIVDAHRKNEEKLAKRFVVKFPLYFIGSVVVLFILSFVDKTCFPA